MLPSFSLVRRLMKLRRLLKKSGGQALLKPLPFGFWFGRGKSADAPIRPATESGWKAAVFLTLYPERLTLPDIADAPEETGDFNVVRKDFFIVASACGAFDLAEKFNRTMSADKRLEAAALERVRDAFAADETLIVPKPDWKRTTERRLVLPDVPALTPLTADEKAALLTTMVFRDGIFVPPSDAFFGRDTLGRPWLKRAPAAVFLTCRERRFVNAFYPALRRGDINAAVAECLFFDGAKSPLALKKDLSAGLPVLTALTSAGADPSPALRFVLSAFDTLPPSAKEESLYADPSRVPDDTAADGLTEALTVPGLVAETFTVRGRGPAAFLNDRDELAALLERNEETGVFLAQKKRRTRLAVFAATGIAVFAVFYCLFQ